MSYGKNEPHGYKILEEDLKNGTLADVNVIILYGEEDYLVSNYTNRLIQHYVAPATMELDLVKIDGSETTKDQIVSYTDTLPMLSERRVVVVDSFSQLINSSNQGADANETKSMVDYLDSLPDSTLLIFKSQSVLKNKPLFKKIKAIGKVYEFTKLERKDLTGFIRKRFKELGKIADNEIINEIINASGYFERESDQNLNTIMGDIKKIASFSESDTVTLPDVSNCINTSLEKDAFALLDAISSGKKNEALLLLNNIMGAGESSFRLLGLIISQMELMVSYSEYSQKGYSTQMIMDSLGLKSKFRLNKAASFADRYSTEKLVSMLKSLYEVDKNIKTGIYNDKLALIMFVSGI